MAEIRPFRALRFRGEGGRDGDLSGFLCPPYDVIGKEEALRLRRRPLNAIRLEAPPGRASASLIRAAALFRRWIERGVLARDPEPAFYVLEESFLLEGRLHKRVGFMAELRISDRHWESVLPHERVIPEPARRRFELLRKIEANTSPIFGIFPDDSGRALELMRRARRGRPIAAGRYPEGSLRFRMWAVRDRAAARAFSAALVGRRIFIADGHHRLGAARALYARTRRPGAGGILACLYPESQGGVFVLPTHRVVKGGGIAEAARGLARLLPSRSLEDLEAGLRAAESPYSFGLWEEGRFFLGIPRHPGGCRMGLSVEWAEKVLLKGVSRKRVSFWSDPRAALAAARRSRGAVVFVKPAALAQLRRAAGREGLLPVKSTYFYPKILTGLVFRDLRPQ